MKIAFIHPDLGIGGAERLVVDAAVGLQNKGHHVTVFTSHHDKSHCFEETRDGTLRVAVLGGNIIPRNIAGKLSLMCAILRQLHLTKSLYSQKLDFDLFIVDQLSASVPILRLLFPRARILFYCHYPDLLLTTRKGLLKKLYRVPLDKLEQWSTSVSDTIAVNSKYTRGVFDETFGSAMPTPIVIYPAVETEVTSDSDYASQRQLERFKNKILLSINRFERKKNIELALEAYSLLLHDNEETRDSILIIAGGYDERVSENAAYLNELRDLCAKYRLPSMIQFPGDGFKLADNVRVLFIPSVSGTLKDLLLAHARVLLYTPTNEHFGIVPLEAMRAKTPVLATNTGGPLETIVDGKTGWLREPSMDAWFNVLGHVLTQASDTELAKMGEAGYDRVRTMFSVAQLADQLDKAARETAAMERPAGSDKMVRTQLIQIAASTLAASVLLVVLVFLLYQVAQWLLPVLADSTQW